MDTGSILRIDKKVKVKIENFINKTLKPEDIDFIPEYTIDQQTKYFDFYSKVNWNDYEQECRKKIYESGKWPKTDLSKTDLEYINEMYIKNVSPTMVASNFVHRTEDKDDKLKNKFENRKHFSKNDDKISKITKSPFDKR